jgi:hypothetical protein
MLPDADDAELATPELDARTVNVYAVPFVNPVTVIGEEDALPVNPPGEEVAV